MSDTKQDEATKPLYVVRKMDDGEEPIVDGDEYFAQYKDAKKRAKQITYDAMVMDGIGQSFCLDNSDGRCLIGIPGASLALFGTDTLLFGDRDLVKAPANIMKVILDKLGSRSLSVYSPVNKQTRNDICSDVVRECKVGERIFARLFKRRSETIYATPRTFVNRAMTDGKVDRRLANEFGLVDMELQSYEQSHLGRLGWVTELSLEVEPETAFKLCKAMSNSAAIKAGKAEKAIMKAVIHPETRTPTTRAVVLKKEMQA